VEERIIAKLKNTPAPALMWEETGVRLEDTLFVSGGELLILS
jgi:hypothetical protein